MAERASAFSAASSARRSPGESLGKISSLVARALPLALARESIGRTCPAAQYRAQGKVLPRGAGHRGNKGDGTETVVNAKSYLACATCGLLGYLRRRTRRAA